MPTTRPENRKKKAKHQSASAKRTIVPQESSNSASPMNAERLRKLYSTMMKCRMASERCAGLFGVDAGASTGHEAAEVGACIHLSDADLVSPTSSLINGNITKGVTLAKLFELIQAGVGEHSVPLATLKLSDDAQIQASTLVSFSHKLSHKPTVSMTIIERMIGERTIGESEATSPDFWESSVQFAAARKLGIVYVICTAADSDHDLRKRALSFQVPGITVDGNDVVAVYRVAEESVRRAREGHGPTLIDCKIDPTRDPLTFMEGYLKKRDLWSDKWHAKVVQEFRRELEQAEKGLS